MNSPADLSGVTRATYGVVAGSLALRVAHALSRGWGACLLILLLVSCVQAPGTVADRGAAVARELIYGSELMSDEELDAYRADMSGLTSDEGRAGYRDQHRLRVRERARTRGVLLDEPAGVIRRSPP